MSGPMSPEDHIKSCAWPATVVVVLYMDCGPGQLVFYDKTSSPQSPMPGRTERRISYFNAQGYSLWDMPCN